MQTLCRQVEEKLSFIEKSISDTEIMTIPGNKFALSRLVECLCNERHQRPIAFVGAGASAELYPLWQPLLRELVKTAVDQGMITDYAGQLWIEKAQDDPPVVAKMIADRLGKAEFRKFIYSQFSRKSTEGRFFTRAQGEIILTRYKGFVTTNYDPGLLEARIRLRRDCSATGYCTRLNKDKLTEWLDGSLFEKEEDCPVFYAHGICDDYQSWVLDIDQYDEAYSDRLYVRVLEKLWMEERLVCIGFSFLDPWVKQMASRLTRELMENSARGIRHFALVGYHAGVEDACAENRRYWLERFGARVIYYPVRRAYNSWSDHSALTRLLNAMRKTCAYSCAFAEYNF